MAMWVRDPKPVVVEVAKPKAHPTSDEDEIIIIEEGFPQEDEIKINDEAFNLSGIMRVNSDGSIFAARGGNDPKDPSCKCFIYCD